MSAILAFLIGRALSARMAALASFTSAAVIGLCTLRVCPAPVGHLSIPN